MDRCYLQQNKHQKKNRNSEDERCTKKQMKPFSPYQNPIVPLRDLPMEDAEIGNEGNSTKTPRTNESWGKVGNFLAY
jgi:hypothetical protein